MGKIIGIDLGTTNSVVAVMEQGQPKLISNAEGKRTTPSVIAFAKNGEVLVGDAARRQAVTNPENTIFSAKRFMGCVFSERREEAEAMPYKVVEGKNGMVSFDVNGQLHTPQEIAAKILSKLKQAAEDYLGEPVSGAVLCAKDNSAVLLPVATVFSSASNSESLNALINLSSVVEWW